MAHKLIEDVAGALPNFDDTKAGHLNSILALLHGIGPKDALEGLLATQMAGVHSLLMEFLSLASRPGQPSGAIDGNVNRANKLLRTFILQLEALNRHRGKISQMVVGTVNVNDGGQAIVGPLNRTGPGISEKKVG